MRLVRIGGHLEAATDGPPLGAEVAPDALQAAVASFAAVDALQCGPGAQADEPEGSCAAPAAVQPPAVL